MAIGGHATYARTGNDKEHAVEVVADVLGSHGVMHHRQQVLQGRCGDGEIDGGGGLRDRRIFLGRKGLQVEFAASGLDGELAIGQAQLDVGFRQGAEDFDQLARVDRGCRIVSGQVEFATGLDLDFQVGGGERQAIAFPLEQDVGKDGERLPAFNDSADDLQRPEHRIAGRFD